MINDLLNKNVTGSYKCPLLCFTHMFIKYLKILDCLLEKIGFEDVLDSETLVMSIFYYFSRF